MPNILIVDDQPHLRELFSLEMIDEGHEVFDVDNPESAMGYLKVSKPDLVLLDLWLKNGFQGWHLLRDIKSKYPHLPVLIVTAYDSYVNDPRVSQADGYIVKNFNAVDKLKQKIAEFLGRKKH